MEKAKKYTISYLRYMKDRNWRNYQASKSLLDNTLQELSKKSEEELTKSDLLLLISRNCDYMRALSLYNYYKDLLTQELTKDNETKDNEQSE